MTVTEDAVIAVADRLAGRGREVERERRDERASARARTLAVAAKHVRDGVELGYAGDPAAYLDRIRAIYVEQRDYWAGEVERERVRPESRLVETYLGAADGCADVLAELMP